MNKLRQSLLAMGLALGFVGLLVACVCVNLALTGNLELHWPSSHPTWW